MRTKVLPLIISVMMHIGMLFVFGAVEYNRNKEKVFTVELMFDVSEVKGQKSGVKSLKSKGRIHITHDYSSSTTHEEKVKTSEPVIQINNEVNEIGSKGTWNAGVMRNSDGSEKDATGNSAIGSSLSKRFLERTFDSIDGPSFLKMVRPEYPRMARRLGKEGRVLLRLIIDESGKLVNVEILEKAGYGFDEAAINAVKASSFQPAKLNRHPVACKAVLPVRFRLEGEN
ncbi:MAG: energy transducer TonB [Nitrospirota bacterium]